MSSISAIVGESRHSPGARAARELSDDYAVPACATRSIPQPCIVKRKAGAECIPLVNSDRKRHQTNNLGDSLGAALGMACELTEVWRHDISWQATMVRGAKRVRP